MAITQALIPEACLQRFIDQPRQRHCKRADLIQREPNGGRVAAGIDKAKRNCISALDDFAQLVSSLYVDFHQATLGNPKLLCRRASSDLGVGVAPAFV